MPISHNYPMDKNLDKNIISVRIYELNNIRTVKIDLNNRKDRGKLRHILLHERYRLRKKDIVRYEDFLNS